MGLICSESLSGWFRWVALPEPQEAPISALGETRLIGGIKPWKGQADRPQVQYESAESSTRVRFCGNNNNNNHY